ncbi:uncharacterized protein [Montipora capricornis]|uniref:uncharacterized protein n=1 Tax=Montipora capricornis TaxID=246305 RepID=UPI0035F1F4E7
MARKRKWGSTVATCGGERQKKHGRRRAFRAPRTLKCEFCPKMFAGSKNRGQHKKDKHRRRNSGTVTTTAAAADTTTTNTQPCVLIKNEFLGNCGKETTRNPLWYKDDEHHLVIVKKEKDG